MPSPIAHSLAGLAIAGIARAKGWISPRASWSIVFVFAANAPDLDFLPDLLSGHPGWFHHGPTHSLIAVAVVAAGSACVAKITSARKATTVGVAIALAYLSHVLLDCMMIRTSASTEVALFWPFADGPIASPVQLFLPIRHGESGLSFVTSLWQVENLYAVALEVLLALGAWIVYRASARV
jgi:inner membrane protein